MFICNAPVKTYATHAWALLRMARVATLTYCCPVCFHATNTNKPMHMCEVTGFETSGRKLLEQKGRMAEFSIIAIFFAGLLGGVLLACAAVSSASSLRNCRKAARWPFHLAYNSGRIVSYVWRLAGGAIGQAGLLLRDVVPIQHCCSLCPV